MKRHMMVFMLTAVCSTSVYAGSGLGSEAAAKATAEAVAECHAQGYQVSAAVVDRSGVLLSLLRHPLAGPHTVDSSSRKAYTSASLKEPSGKLAGLVAAKPELQGLHHMNESILLLGGGLPIFKEDKLVGAIGVGGAPGAHLDEGCAKAGIKAIGAKASH